ncbi:MAG TPA: fused MFS/spermidine synthase [Gemmatimonadaceae bacterium]|nr:fused MFS/spermidine synthase [Gemmatimonadaceae bacterium]
MSTQTSRRTQAYTPPRSAAVPASPILEHRFLPLLVLLFVGSGCAALIYEIVWFQLLSLIIGSSAVSMAVLLGTFMGGMCIGSLLLAKYISRAQHPLRVYAMLEGAIAIFGLLVLWGLPYAGGLYFAIALHGMADLLLRGLFCAICLLPPTILMGATLPAISRWVETTPEGVAWLGFFYGGNIAGAVFGCLLAGFYLLRVHDMSVATYAAVAIDVAVALASYALARVTRYEAPADAIPDDDAKPALVPRGTWPVYVAIGLSGATALAAEAVWTRLLSLLLGATTYTFSLILAAFLIGLGVGSSVGSMMSRTMRNPRVALGICQLLLTACVAWAAYVMTKQLPYWPIRPDLAVSPTYTFEVDLVRCLWTVIPAALLWGASFPLALAAVGEGEKDPGRLVGTVYAANTVGGIVGALAGSLLIIAWLGTQASQRILIVAAGLSAAIVLAPEVVSATKRLRISARGAAWGAAALVLAFLCARTVPPVPPLLVGYGRWFVTRLDNANDFIYMGEGITASVAVSQLPNGVLNYHNAGKVQASSEPQDMRLQRMLGHLTTLLPAHPDNVLVIGCGAGVTAGAVSVEPRLKSETIAEIEPLVPKVVSKYFGAYNFNVVTNPKVHVEIDDARHFILTTTQKFDAVTSDPLDPWVKGAATLYTKEFFDVVKQHLNPGGVVTLFVQLYESNTEAVKSEIATFFQAFPNGVIFGNTNNGGGYDLVLVGQLGSAPIRIDVDAIQQRLQQPEYAVVAHSLQEIGFDSATQLFSTFAGNEPMLRPWLADAQINHDRNLRLQFLAGLGLNQYDQAGIYSQMLQYRRFPDGLFTGSPQTIEQIRMNMGGY